MPNSLETLLVARLTGRGWRLALAESCTGGMVAGRVTSISGASEVFLGGVVAYDNAVKQNLLGVPAETLAASGAVSADTALAMAHGVRRLMRADLSAAVTGIAGPGGGSDAKPVGLVFVAVAGPDGARVERFLFTGDRHAVRAQSCDAALRLLVGACGA